jgi:hypothetical protein
MLALMTTWTIAGFSLALATAPPTAGNSDFGVDLIHVQFVEPMPLRAGP